MNRKIRREKRKEIYEIIKKAKIYFILQGVLVKTSVVKTVWSKRFDDY